MTFLEFSETYTPLIDEALQTYLTFELKDNRQALAEAMRYSGLAKAKRIRPLLVLAIAQCFELDPKPVLSLAASVECIHCYSLIHDDLPAMDNDDFRRGQPTCHKKFGESTAILAGDTLSSFAFELLATHLPSFFPADQILKVITLISKSIGIYGMAGGQMLDLNPEKSPNPDDLIKIHTLKTGALFEASICAPAILYQCSEKSLEGLQSFAFHLGMLFQITDDILDQIGLQIDLGKSIRKDEAQDKVTYISLWGLEGAQEKARFHAAEATQALEALDIKNRILFDDLVQYILERNR